MLEQVKIKYQELAAKKRAELEAALERGQIADPITTILISGLISTAITGVAGPLGHRLLPKKEKNC